MVSCGDFLEVTRSAPEGRELGQGKGATGPSLERRGYAGHPQCLQETLPFRMGPAGDCQSLCPLAPCASPRLKGQSRNHLTGLVLGLSRRGDPGTRRRNVETRRVLSQKGAWGSTEETSAGFRLFQTRGIRAGLTYPTVCIFAGVWSPFGRSMLLS